MRGLYKTDIEDIMEKALIEANIPATPQYPIRCKYGYIADFAIPEQKIIIECDGEAWHKKGNAHDRKRDAYLKSMGWTIIRFKGNEIKSNSQSCIEKIKHLYGGAFSASVGFDAVCNGAVLSSDERLGKELNSYSSTEVLNCSENSGCVGQCIVVSSKVLQGKGHTHQSNDEKPLVLRGAVSTGLASLAGVMRGIVRYSKDSINIQNVKGGIW